MFVREPPQISVDHSRLTKITSYNPCKIAAHPDMTLEMNEIYGDKPSHPRAHTVVQQRQCADFGNILLLGIGSYN